MRVSSLYTNPAQNKYTRPRMCVYIYRGLSPNPNPRLKTLITLCFFRPKLEQKIRHPSWSSEDKYGTRDVYSLHFDNSPWFGEYSKLTHPFLAYMQIKTQEEEDKKQENTAAATSTSSQPQHRDRRVWLVGTWNGLYASKMANLPH